MRTQKFSVFIVTTTGNDSWGLKKIQLMNVVFLNKSSQTV